MRSVLMLHGVDGSGSVVSISADDLSRLIDAIRNSGHEIVPLTRWLSESGDRQIALTFDDGFESLRNAAAPLLAEAGAPATLFLTTGSLGGESRWPSLPEGAAVFPMLGWDDVRHLHESGWEIEAHTVTHPDLRACSDSEIAEEMEGSAAAIERELGRRPRVFAYPYGFCDDRVVAAARQSFEWAVTARMTGALQPAGDPHRVPRLDAYYFRSPVLSRAFGSKRFSQYLSARAWLRRMRGHPAES